jgi:hypothetical protein
MLTDFSPLVLSIRLYEMNMAVVVAWLTLRARDEVLGENPLSHYSYIN